MKRGHYAEVYALLGNGELSGDQAWRLIREAQSGDPVRNRYWEFVAAALLHRFDHEPRLAPELAERLTAMRPLWHDRHESMNFRLMRAVAEARLAGRMLRAADLSAMGLKPRPDGALPDGPEGISSQYHAYMLLLIMRWGDRGDAALRLVVERGFAWLHGIWRAYGDPSPLGRGRFQLFGYAALAAACSLADDWGVPQPRGYAAHVHDRLEPEPPEGALSARWAGPFRDALLHGYNTPDDYRAFAAFWTAGIPRQTPAAPPDTLVRHHLDFAGSCIVADGGGPLFCLTPTPLGPSEYLGRKRELLAMLRGLGRKEHYAENLAPERLSNCGCVINGLDFRLDGRALTMETPANPMTHTPVIWAPGHVGEPRVEGIAEATTWEWSRSAGRPWTGHSFRIFGRSRVRWIFG